MTNKKNSAGTVGFIFLAMLMSKVLGQAREMVIAYTYGTAWQADSYVAASQIPTNFFDMILGSAISAAFIPVFNKFMEKDGDLRAKRFASVFFNNIFIISFFIALLGVVFAPQLISVLTPDLSPEASALATKLLRIMFPMVISIASAFTFVGLLQSMGEYNLPAVMSMVSSLVCIIYLVTLEKYFGITGLAISLVIGWALQFLILMPSTLKKGFRFSLHFFDRGIWEVCKLALPVLVGTWVQPINVMINTRISSGIDGGVSAINYANKLYLIAAGVFAMSLTNYIFPRLSRLSVAKEDREKWLDVFYSSLKTVILAVTPIAMVFIIQSDDIIRVIYQRGEFGEASVKASGGALLFYSIGILPYAMQEIMYKSFYSLRKSVTPMIVAVLGIGINILLSFTLSPVMGINGLALAASVSVIFTSVFSFLLITKFNKKAAGFVVDSARILLPGVISAVLTFVVKLVLPFDCETFVNRVLNLCIPAVCGVVCYIVLLFVFKIPEVKTFLNTILKKGENHEE